MMSEIKIKSEIERHKKLRDYEISVKNREGVIKHMAMIEAYETVIRGD